MLNGLIKSIRSKVMRLRESEASYFKGDPIMSDSEYDETIESAQQDYERYLKLNKGIDDLQLTITPPTDLGKVRDRDSFNEWLVEVNKSDQIDSRRYSFYLEPKYDGVNLTLIYINGLLTEALLRGNDYGERMNIKELLMGNEQIPLKISLKKSLEIRGELILPLGSKEIIGAKLNSKYKTNRAALVALINRENREYLSAYAHFKPYFMNLAGKKTKKVFNAQEFGWEEQKIKRVNLAQIYEAFEYLQYNVSDYSGFTNVKGYELDGLVVTYSEGTEEDSIAIKPRPTCHHTAIVRDVKWTMNDYTSKLSCSLIIDPIQYGTREFTKVHIKDYSLFENNEIMINKPIKVKIENDLMKFVSGVQVKPDPVYQKILLPSTCCYCFKPYLILENLIQCNNPHCTLRLIGKYCAHAETFRIVISRESVKRFMTKAKETNLYAFFYNKLYSDRNNPEFRDRLIDFMGYQDEEILLSMMEIPNFEFKHYKLLKILMFNLKHKDNLEELKAIANEQAEKHEMIREFLPALKEFCKFVEKQNYWVFQWISFVDKIRDEHRKKHYNPATGKVEANIHQYFF